MCLVDQNDDVAPGRQVLAGFSELVDGRGDDAAHVVGQQGTQLLAVGRLVEVGVPHRGGEHTGGLPDELGPVREQDDRGRLGTRVGQQQ